jgi:hypothetical protein
MRYLLIPFLLLLSACAPQQVPTLPHIPLENDKIVAIQVTIQGIQAAIKQMNGHTDPVGTTLLGYISPQLAIAYIDSQQSQAEMNANNNANAASQKKLLAQIATDQANAKTQNDLDVRHFKQTLLGLIIVAIFGIVGGVVLEGCKYVPSFVDKMLIRGGTTLLAVSAGTVICTLVIGQLIPWVIYAAMGVIGVATIILIIAMIKFAVEAKWHLGTIVTSVEAGLSAIPPEAAATMKQTMSNIQTPVVSSVVAAVKASSQAAPVGA